MSQWWNLRGPSVVGYCGYTNVASDCCQGYVNTLENAMYGDTCWIHQVDHWHWATFDLGEVVLVEWLRGDSEVGGSWCGGDPWLVDVYVSEGESYGNWNLVASNINTWRYGFGNCIWREVDCADAGGRYVLVEIKECWWYGAEPYRDWLRWGTPGCGSGGHGNHGFIFDIYGTSGVPVYTSGAAYCAASASAELSGIAQSISGTNEFMLAAWSKLVDQFTLLAGRIDIQSTVHDVPAMATPAPLYGSTLGMSGASGVLEFVPFTELVAGTVSSGTSALGVLTDASVRLAGTIAVQSTVGGELAVPEHLVGAVGIQSSTIGELTVIGTQYLVGSIASRATVGGKLAGITRYHVGVATIQSSVVGEIVVVHTGPPRYVYLGGTIACQSTASGELAGLTRELAATVAIESSASGVMRPIKGLASAVTCSSDCTGILTTHTPMEGTVTSSMLMGGSLKITKRLVGTISSQSTVSAEISVVNVYFLIGKSTASSNVAGSLKITKELASTILPEGTVSGSISITRRLAGTITPQSMASGLMERGRSLVGAAAAVSALTCSYLTLEKTVVGVLSSTSIVTGKLIRAGELQVTVTVQSTVGGLLKVGRRFNGTIFAVTVVSGVVHYRVPRFVIADAFVSPVLACTILVSSTLEFDANNQPVLAHAVRASPAFTFTTDSLPIFVHSTRVNEELKVLV